MIDRVMSNLRFSVFSFQTYLDSSVSLEYFDVEKTSSVCGIDFLIRLILLLYMLSFLRCHL